MSAPDMWAQQNSDLSKFLYSVVESDHGGAPVSVISLLARSGVDPWSEAGRLARLPKEAATGWLAQRIAGATVGLASPPDAKAVAGRLVALLPLRVESTSQASAPAPSPLPLGGSFMNSWSLTRTRLLLLSVCALGTAIVLEFFRIAAQ